MNNIPHSVSVKNLSVIFGDFYAVKNITFNVTPGEIFGFLGANGAGKTTTIRVLCGLISPSSGEIEIMGEKFKNAGANLKMKVGYMSQKFTLYDDMTVEENLNFAGDLHRLSKKTTNQRKLELLDFVGWTRDRNTLVRELPGGLKQQISLVASIMHDPQIIFLDEPTAGVSPHSRSLFWNLIRKLSKQGKTVFVTTHYMDEAEECDRIALMREGELVALNSPPKLKFETFPVGLIELEPKMKLSNDQITRLKNFSEFSMFEPYGLRFHAEWKQYDHSFKDNLWIEELCNIKRINPSLEDVFIRIVEGNNR